MARSLKMVNTVVLDSTRPVEQKGFNALAVVDCTQAIATQLIYDASTITAGSDLYKGVSMAFGNGMSSVWVGGVAPNPGDPTTITDLITELATVNNVYNFTFIIAKEYQAQIIEAISETAMALEIMVVTELNGTPEEVVAIIEATNSKRMAFVCTADEMFTGVACGLYGYGASATPGTLTYSNRPIQGVSLSGYTNAGNQLVLDSNGIVFAKEKGLIISRMSNTSDGNFIDVTTSTDYMKHRLEEALVFLMVNIPKIGYTDRDIDEIRTALVAPGDTFVEDNILEDYKLILPRAASVPVNDKANRVLNGVRFEAKLTGSVETLFWNLVVKLK